MSEADVYLPAHGHNQLSQGLVNDARIIGETLGQNAVKVFSMPDPIFKGTRNQNDAMLQPMKSSNTAIFLEHVFESSELMDYERRIFIANPEWLVSKDAERVRTGYVTEFWHKTRSGLQLLSHHFPNHIHKYIGFTSRIIVQENNSPDYSSLGHFAGKAFGRRHTQELLEIWEENRNLPRLSVHFYHSESPAISRWLTDGSNLRLRMGMMEESQFLNEFSSHGVHLCTSSTEGFGHHINEARAIGALVITLDAPPMNELIDPESGILVPFSEKHQLCHGYFYRSTKDRLLSAIKKACALSQEERSALGKRARARFLSEQEEFVKNLKKECLG